jgi:hypothetical protein
MSSIGDCDLPSTFLQSTFLNPDTYFFSLVSSDVTALQPDLSLSHHTIVTTMSSLSDVYCDAATNTAGYVQYISIESLSSKNLDCKTSGDGIIVVSISCARETELS